MPESLAAKIWQAKLNEGATDSAEDALGKLEGRIAQVQRLDGFLSTRHVPVTLAGRGRLLLPEGFREFLAVEPGAKSWSSAQESASNCGIHPQSVQYLEASMPRPSLVRSAYGIGKLFHARSDKQSERPPGLCHPVGMQVITD